MDNNIKKATNMAVKAHKGQLYGNTDYFLTHITEVFKIAKSYNFESDILVSCILHDIIEDTSIKYKDIEIVFGQTIAEIVYNVTDELGRDRNESKLKTYVKIRSCPKSTAVKLCDRLSNVRYSIDNNDFKSLNRYRNEHTAFRQMLYNDLNLDLKNIWIELDNLLK